MDENTGCNRTTSSRTLSTSNKLYQAAEKRKRSPSSQSTGNMSKKSTADNDPSNALIMRTLTNLGAKFDKLPTIDHLNKLEADLHTKIESNTKALKEELRAEFRTEMQEQAAKVNKMVDEVRNQVGLGASNGRNDVQQGRYLRARRSFKIWPLRVEGTSQDQTDQAVRKFFVQQMKVPAKTALNALLDNVRQADQARNSKIENEYIVTFADVESRDTINSYASGLAEAKGAAGLHSTFHRASRANSRS